MEELERMLGEFRRGEKHPIELVAYNQLGVKYTLTDLKNSLYSIVEPRNKKGFSPLKDKQISLGMEQIFLSKIGKPYTMNYNFFTTNYGKLTYNLSAMQDIVREKNNKVIKSLTSPGLEISEDSYLNENSESAKRVYSSILHDFEKLCK